MNLALPLLGFLVLLGLYYQDLTNNLGTQQNKMINFLDKKRAFSLSENRMDLAKRELKMDTNWNDCENADQLCDQYDTNYFPIYSSIENGPMENYEFNKRKNTVWFLPLSETEGILISETRTNKGKEILGELVQQGLASAKNYVPVIKSENYDLEEDINLCTYTYNPDTCEVETTEMYDPDFSIYTQDQDILDKFTIMNPRDYTEVECFANMNQFQFEYTYDFQSVFNKGSIHLESGVNIEVAYAEHELTIEPNVQVEEFAENVEVPYPNFQHIPEINININSDQDLVCNSGQAIYINSDQKYDNITLYGGCDIYMEDNGHLSSNTLTIRNAGLEHTVRVRNRAGFGEIVANDIVIEEDADFEIENDTCGSEDYFHVKAKNITVNENGRFRMRNMFRHYFDFENMNYHNNTKIMGSGKVRAMHAVRKMCTMLTPFCNDDTTQEFIGNFYTESIDNDIEGTYFCNTVVPGDDEKQATYLTWDQISWNDSGLGETYITVIDSRKKISCSSVDSCIERLYDYYEENQD